MATLTEKQQQQQQILEGVSEVAAERDEKLKPAGRSNLTAQIESFKGNLGKATPAETEQNLSSLIRIASADPEPNKSKRGSGR